MTIHTILEFPADAMLTMRAGELAALLQDAIENAEPAGSASISLPEPRWSERIWTCPAETRLTCAAWLARFVSG